MILPELEDPFAQLQVRLRRRAGFVVRQVAVEAVAAAEELGQVVEEARLEIRLRPTLARGAARLPEEGLCLKNERNKRGCPRHVTAAQQNGRRA